MCYFSKTKCKSSKTIWNDFFMSKQVRLPKINWILQEMKIVPKSDIVYPLLARKPSRKTTANRQTVYSEWSQNQILQNLSCLSSGAQSVMTLPGMHRNHVLRRFLKPVTEKRRMYCFFLMYWRTIPQIMGNK